jgi:hypothetical protein
LPNAKFPLLIVHVEMTVAVTVIVAEALLLALAAGGAPKHSATTSSR